MGPRLAGAVERPLTSERLGARPKKLQWGHGAGAVERFEDARGRRPLAADKRAFNGATARGPWKDKEIREYRTKKYNASMGPRRRGRGKPGRYLHACGPSRQGLQWGHGAGAVERGRHLHLAGRTVMLQWGHGAGAVEKNRLADGETRKPGLQWGHGAEAVERQPSRPGAALNCSLASMGPRLAGAVERPSAQARSPAASSLQWGHG